MKSPWFILLLLTTLAGCSLGNQRAEVPQVISDCFNHTIVRDGAFQPVYCEDEKRWRRFVGSGYSIMIPGIMFRFGDDSEPTFDTNATNDPDEPDDYRSVIHHLSSTCTSILTGIRFPDDLPGTGGKTIWGREDVWDGIGNEGWEFPPDWQKIACKKEGIPPPGEIYVLCSEKNAKTVVICISQMKDDPKMAEEIFKTFRWL